MAAPEFPQIPLVDMRAAANTGNQWVAVTLRVDGAGVADPADVTAAWHAVFASPDLLAAVAPLDCVVFVANPGILTAALLDLMPPNRVVFAIDADALSDEGAPGHISALHDEGYRILIDGAVPAGFAPPPMLRAVSLDCTDRMFSPGTLSALFGPHLARAVNTGAQREQCERAGFSWFSGSYPIHPEASDTPDDGSSRKRLLSLLGLLAADAETHALETLLKQDPALCFQLLKLVNSAAFAISTPITSFSQAIGLLGRRQLQRWLQLLLYARQREDGLANPLLPVAALRAAQMESLCKQGGGDRNEQDLAFVVGVFSLLDVLLGMPMDEIVGALNLPPAAAAALTERSGALGRQLRLVETDAPSQDMLREADVTPLQWWNSQLHAHHWAIQVSRNL
ncbi:HDOD domain-containing protein [Massilia sp. TWR1-2-2]|uniref:HDOD domain-containing protein n=1 Tax=Massilia sp. TWR1-2-2 TaxID=2804584 RepID=UPI003CE8B22D